MLHRLVFVNAVLFVVATTVCGREWTDNTGTFHVEADLQAVEGRLALLTKADGSALKVPLDRLCDSDRRFATKLNSAVTLDLANDHSLECTVLQENSASFTILHNFMVLRVPRSEVRAVKELDSTDAPATTRPPRFAEYTTVIVAAAVQPWASDFQQIPATVIDNGVLRNVPYKSFRTGKD